MRVADNNSSSLICKTSYKVEPRFKNFSKKRGLCLELSEEDENHPIDGWDQSFTNSFKQVDILNFYDNLISPIPLETPPPFHRCQPSSSMLTHYLYMGSEKIACNKHVLELHGITHIINCSGLESHNPFPEDFVYLTLPLHDTPSQDIASSFAQVEKFVEGALKSRGKIFVHCLKGVSRSAAVVISYLMVRNR